MKLVRIRIENFKSFVKLDLNLDENKNVIIGKNNSGKSAFLEAIKLMLNPFNKGKDNPVFDERFNDENLYHDINYPIKIELFFSFDEEEVKNIEEFTNPVSERRVYTELEGGKILFHLKFERKYGEEGTFYYDDNCNFNEYVKIATYRYFNSLVFDTNRTLDIIKSDDFQKDSSSISFRLIITNLIMKFISSTESKLNTGNFYNLFNDWFFSVEKSMLESFFPEIKSIKFIPKEELKEDIFSDPLTSLYKKSEFLLDNLTIIVNDGKEQDLSFKGCGLQNLFLFSLILKANDFFQFLPIICIDEVELYLHPIAQKNLNIKLSNIKNQFILTSHSDKFVINSNPDQLIIFKKNYNSNITRSFVLNKEEKDLYKLFQKVVKEENSEFLFSDYVILVEGLSDKVFFSHILKLEETFNNCSIINMNSKDNVNNFIKILNKFEIPYHIILDNDALNLENKIEIDNLYDDNIHILSKGELEDYYPKHLLKLPDDLKILKKYPRDFKFKVFAEAIYENKELLDINDEGLFIKSLNKIFDSKLNKKTLNLEEKKFSEILCSYYNKTKYELALYVCDLIQDNILLEEELLNILGKIKKKPISIENQDII
ncbi:MAG: AAA family ATPase [Nanoarchaeota archaeon]|nr:AAA family ATPase [Nanoarchaeota archaeon]